MASGTLPLAVEVKAVHPHAVHANVFYATTVTVSGTGEVLVLELPHKLLGREPKAGERLNVRVTIAKVISAELGE